MTFRVGMKVVMIDGRPDRLGRPPAPAVEVREAKRLINERLEDLQTANALYGKDQRLSAPDKVARNDREISWLKDLRSYLSASPREMGQESDGNESQAKATEGKAGMAGVDGPVRRSTAGTGLQVGEASADLPATSEIMDVTAGRDRQPIHESDGGSMEQPFALADAARESPAPRASSGKQEGRTGSEVGAEQIAGSSMSYGPDKPIIAGQAPGPSEPSPSSRSETAWQPIETAPHNTSVLLGWRDWRDGQWCVEVGAATTGQRYDNGYSNISQHGSATHWQSLPSEGPL